MHPRARLRSLSARPAFTLIELLIVVAIIAILAAIAVPNFLEAQTRSKVARVLNDHRTLATALEAYFVDHNRYPIDSDNTFGQGQNGFVGLTTPLPYITGLLDDPFSPEDPGQGSDYAPHYVLASGSSFMGTGLNLPIIHAYTLISLGPDGDDSSDLQDAFPYLTFYKAYDPTNGTISTGDVYRFGGAIGESPRAVNGWYLTAGGDSNGDDIFVLWSEWGTIPVSYPSR